MLSIFISYILIVQFGLHRLSVSYALTQERQDKVVWIWQAKGLKENISVSVEISGSSSLSRYWEPTRRASYPSITLRGKKKKRVGRITQKVFCVSHSFSVCLFLSFSVGLFSSAFYHTKIFILLLLRVSIIRIFPISPSLCVCFLVRPQFWWLLTLVTIVGLTQAFLAGGGGICRMEIEVSAHTRTHTRTLSRKHKPKRAMYKQTGKTKKRIKEVNIYNIVSTK